MNTRSVRAQSLIHVWLFVTSWTVARQVSLFMGFPRQEYWSGLPFPSPGDLQTHVFCIGRQILYHWATRKDEYQRPKINSDLIKIKFSFHLTDHQWSRAGVPAQVHEVIHGPRLMLAIAPSSPLWYVADALTCVMQDGLSLHPHARQ